MGGNTCALSNGLLACGIGAWLRTFGMVAPISCTIPSLLDYFFLNFALGARSVTLVMSNGTMFRFMFGQIIATRPPQRTAERMGMR